mgnify:CR=1 FL=1
MKEIKGDFDWALTNLISRLSTAKSHPTLGKFATELLREWDATRGNDWYTATGKRGERDGN